MSLKTKLSLGLGFLFCLLLGVIGFYSYHIEKLARESQNILQDNYASIVYAKNMLLALENMRTSGDEGLFNTGAAGSTDYASRLFAAGKAAFDDNLKAERSNITEIHEKEGVDLLMQQYDLFLNLTDQLQKGPSGGALYFSELMPAYEKLRQSIVGIEDLNMQAVERKSALAQQDAARMIRVTAIIASICIVLAIGYLWYFPFYVSNTLTYLADRMKALLKHQGIAAELKTEDEAMILLQSINLLETTVGAKKTEREGG